MRLPSPMKMLSGRIVRRLCSRERVSRCGVLANMVESMCSILLWERLRLRMEAAASARAEVNRLLTHTIVIRNNERINQEAADKYIQ